MGYASYGDNARAQEMIDYARMRLDGSTSPLVDPANVTAENFDQVFKGGVPTAATRDASDIQVTGAPFKGGFDLQGWAYGGRTFQAVIDYLLVVRSATGEDVITPRLEWLSEMLRALKHGLMPDRFRILPSGDWGSDYGAVISRNLPARLAYLLEGAADGPGAQNFFTKEIAASSPYPDYPEEIFQSLNQPDAWEAFFFEDPARPSAPLQLPPYYTGWTPTNGAVPYFYLRSDWGADATWAFLHMGAAWYNDHQHTDAGHLLITRGGDPLLVDASNWKGVAGSSGLVGSSYDEVSGHAGAANTLWFNDFGDFQRSAETEYYAGGQGFWGKDEVVAAEQNDSYSFLRSDLSTAYNRSGGAASQSGRRLDYFYRTIVYARSPNIFLVLDQVKAVPSTNPIGPYRKHLRWHFPTSPTISGKQAFMTQGTSRLYLDTLLPENAALKSVDESRNPDPCDGTTPPCTRYGEEADSGTWRLEVSDPSNPAAIDFLTVLQANAASAQPATAVKVASLDARMVGAQISRSQGVTDVVLVNVQSGAAPAPISSTSYPFSGARTATHTLCGVMPRGRYTVSYSGSTVTVSQSGAGEWTASPTGVLQFTLGASDVLTTLFFPRLVTRNSTRSNPDDSEYTGIAVANLDAADATLTLTAYDRNGAKITGSGITNSASLSLRRNAQLPMIDSEIFGQGLPAKNTVGWVRLDSTVRKIVGFFLMFNAGLNFLDGADVSSGTLTSFVLPEIEDQGFSQIHVANPDPSAATVTFELLRSDGTARAPAVSRTIAPNGAMAEPFTELFPGVAAAGSDYIRVASTRGVVPFEYLGKAGSYAAGLNGQDTAAGSATLYSPQYAVGGGVYRTSLSIVNVDATPGTVTLRLIRDDGTQIGGSRQVAIAPRGKVHLTDQSFLVDSSVGLTQGYLEITCTGARLTGSVVFGDPDRARFAAALPLVSTLRSSYVFSQAASNATYFTGIALLNPNAAAANATVELFDRAGALVRASAQQIRPRSRVARLLTELFSDLVGAEVSSGYIKVTADAPIAAFALFGTSNLTDPTRSLALSAVPGQVVP
jgi:hypothetical protein